MNSLELPLLSLITFIPLLGAGFIFVFARGTVDVVDRNSRSTALAVSLITFVLACFLIASFDQSEADFQFVERVVWISGLNISYYVGVDGVSILFILLTALLIPICILASWSSITVRVKEYMIAFLVLETMVIGVFCAIDLLVFYVFFEAVLIPMFIIIGVWGGSNRVYAAIKFFLYTLLGSVLMLVAVVFIYLEVGTSAVPSILQYQFSPSAQFWLFLAFFASFAVKVPMWPFHTWLPDAHVQAPTAGSVILAGILLKMGGYGFIRFSIPLFPEASSFFAPYIFVLSIIAVIYTSLVAYVQEDMKKLVAYSSVAHMGFVTAGLFSLNQQGVEGSLFVMLSHGIVSAALFLVVGVLYDRLHTKEIARFGGVARNMPIFSAVFMVFMLASIGLPGTSGFIGEFLVLVGVYKYNTIAAAFTALGLILGAVYMLGLYKKVVFGPLTKGDVAKLADLNTREVVVFLPLLFLVAFMGIYPSAVTNYYSKSVEGLLHDHQESIGTKGANLADDLFLRH